MNILKCAPSTAVARTARRALASPSTRQRELCQRIIHIPSGTQQFARLDVCRRHDGAPVHCGRSHGDHEITSISVGLAARRITRPSESRELALLSRCSPNRVFAYDFPSANAQRRAGTTAGAGVSPSNTIGYTFTQATRFLCHRRASAATEGEQLSKPCRPTMVRDAHKSDAIESQ